MIIDYDLIHESWLEFFNRPDIKNIINNINDNISYTNYYPLEDEIFRFTKLDLNKMKYVLISMDPYKQHFIKDGNKYPVANGRSFEPRNYDNWTDETNNSCIRNFLKTIYYIETGELKVLKEIREEIKNNKFNILPPHEWFNSLEKQGVLFLNYILTVKPKISGSHSKLWKEFSEELIKFVDSNYNIEFLLLGNDAQELKKLIKKRNAICDSHPATYDFIKNKHTFQKLKNNGINIT